MNLRLAVTRYFGPAILLALMAVACTGRGDPRAIPSDVPSSTVSKDSLAGDMPAPEFPVGLDWLNTERPLTLAELRGKVVLLDFWTYGCINCQQIIPDLEALENEFGDALVVIGVHSAKFTAEGNTDAIRQVVLRYGIEHPVINDVDFTTWNLWGAQAWPTVVLIDPAGKVVGGHAGEGIYPIFQPVVASLIEEFGKQGTIDTSPLELQLEAEGRPDTVLSFPGGVLVDDENSRLFVADTNHHRIVVADLESGQALAVYGSGSPGYEDGLAGSFRSPHGMVLTDDGELLVADTGNHALRAIDLRSGLVSTVAGTGQKGTFPTIGGAGTTTALYSPWALERIGSDIWVAMAGSHQLWKLNLVSGEISPAVGNGREGVTGGDWSNAQLAQPSGLVVSSSRLYFVDSESSSIRYADLDHETVGLLAGTDLSLFDFGDQDGEFDRARFQHPLGITADPTTAFVADTYNSNIRWIDLATGRTGTLAGSESGWRDGDDPQFSEPGGIDLSADGRLFVADTNNHAIRIVDQVTGAASTFLMLGVEAVEPAVDAADFTGTVLRLDPQALRPGPVQISLDVILPNGYKVNPLAPSTFAWTGIGLVIPPEVTGTFVDPDLPVFFSADVSGSGSLAGEISLVYCEAETESICLLERFRVEVPVMAAAGGVSHVAIEHVVRLPRQ